jgi:Na+-transporting methylmalonyl-CoA/oxaloacetate decarboxylase gamma subunit
LAEVIEGLDLMWKGMIIVFGFLVLLMVFMKLVPIISKRRFSRNSTTNDPKLQSSSKPTKITRKNDSKNQNRVTSIDDSEVPEAVVAAIAAAIYTHTGKKPKHLMIQSAAGTREPYNIWSVAGRQDLMVSRDLTGQVGFQY